MTLHEQTAQEWENDDDPRDCFEEIIEPLLESLIHAEDTHNGGDEEAREVCSHFLRTYLEAAVWI